jgi:hypothetical protein
MTTTNREVNDPAVANDVSRVLRNGNSCSWVNRVRRAWLRRENAPVTTSNPKSV